ncbi:hypothetical protein ELOC111193_16635 [Elizabethkingia occulta]|uniref:Uncharacterized protein n=1 Tax=Elizabethkingia occulta TaxID=1867263 RepID=A0A1T3M8X3_9FLAO|nr:hypothetical protein [Elizabethkingia occulta]OPB89360.1 hypothetical protein BB020_12365 [Elizabethkingia occulta]OPC61065.1 hypothetical protein BAZ10_11375 [Elizabethkingia occulta]
MKENLHIKFVESSISKIDMDTGYGVLKLPKASSFSVVVEEYEKETKAFDDEFDKNVELSKKRWNERSKAGWSSEKLLENWKANEAERLKTYKEKQKNIQDKYKDVNWTWVLAPRKLDSKSLAHNASFNKGIEGAQTVHFPEVLEGGGLAYIEAFFPEAGAQGKKPFGLFVQAIGIPSIVRTAWTDMQDNPIPVGTKIYWGSHVKLHIYTSGLYGQEVEVTLKDKDTFILDSDDDLNFGGQASFMSEVDAVRANKNEEGKEGVAGMITENEEKVRRTYIQKSVIKVWIDYSWIKDGGSNIKIYPLIKSVKTGKYFENFERNYLEVGYDGKQYNWEKDSSNKPALVGQIETNIAAYHPCHYNEIALQYEEKKETKTIEIFKEQEGVSYPQNVDVGIIAGSDPKNFKLKVDEKTETLDCIFHGKNNDHAKNIFVYNKNKLPKEFSIINLNPKYIEGTGRFVYDRLDMLKYFWLPNDFANTNKYSHFKINASTCRHNHICNLTILPDIEWELAFIITTMAGFRIKAENTTVTRLEQGLGKYQFKGIKAEQSGKLIEKGGVGYSLNIKYSIDGGAFYEQISLDFVRNIEKIIDTYNAIAAFAAIFKGEEESVTSAAISKSVINKITFDIDPPAIVFLLKWKYDYAKKNKVPVVNFIGAAGFKPLIGFKIGVDLMQNLSFLGLAGKVLDFINKNIIKKYLKTDLYILLEVGTALNYDIGLSYNEIDGFDLNEKQKAVVDITFSFKAGVKKKDTIMVSDVRRMEGNTIPAYPAEQETFKVEGAITTGIRYTEEHGYEKGKGKYKKTDVKWLGAEMTITIVTIAQNRKQNAPPNDQFKDKFIIMAPRPIGEPSTTYDNEQKK